MVAGTALRNLPLRETFLQCPGSDMRAHGFPKRFDRWFLFALRQRVFVPLLRLSQILL